MSPIIFLSLVALVICSAVLGYTGYRVLRAWQKYREEVLVHVTFLTWAMALIIIVFGGIVVTNPLPGQLNRQALFVMGVVYDLFYLELSFIYLTLFSNSRAFYEKYIPILLGSAIILNVIAGTTTDESYIQIGFFFHFFIISLGLFMIAKSVWRFRRSEAYITNEKEKLFIKHLEKFLAVLLLLLLFDGSGFLLWHLFVDAGHIFTEVEWLVYSTAGLVLSLLFLWLAMDVGKKFEGCDLTLIMNNLS